MPKPRSTTRPFPVPPPAPGSAEHDAFLSALGRELNNAVMPVLLGIERLRPILAAGDTAHAARALANLEHAGAGFARRAQLLGCLAGRDAAPATPIETVMLAPLLHEAALRHQDAARRACSAILVEAPPGLAAAAAPDKLALILDELICNALRFAPGRPLRLSAAPIEGGGVRLSVLDEGPGFAPDALADVAAARRRSQAPFVAGLGIALAVAHELAGAMGGTIGAENRNSGGAHVFVNLPAATMAEPLGESH